MGFYRTLLEEELEVNVLDDNNTNDPAVEELIDDIDKGMENEEERVAAQDAEFGDEPGPAPEDALDESFMVIAEAEMNWNTIMQEAAIEELNEGVLTESLEGIKAWFKKVKDAVTKFFKKVFQVIKRWASDLFAVMHTNKGFATKYATQIKTGEAIYNKNDTKKIKGYPFTGIAKTSKNNLTEWKDNATTIKNTAKRYITTIKAFLDTYKDSKEDEIKDVDASEYSYYMKKIVDHYSDAVTVEDGTFSADLTKLRDLYTADIRFGQLDSSLANNAPEEMDTGMPSNTIIDALKNGSTIKKNINDSLTSAKDAFKASIDSLNALEKLLESKSTAIASKLLPRVSKYNKNMQTINNMNQVMRSAYMSNIRKYIHQCRRFGNYYVMLANRKNPKMNGFQKESTYLGGIDLI